MRRRQPELTPPGKRITTNMSKDSQLVVWLTELGVGEDVVEAVRIAQFVFQQLAIFLIDFFYQVSG